MLKMPQQVDSEPFSLTSSNRRAEWLWNARKRMTPGEAQVDFTTIQVSHDQQLMTYKLLVVSFPYSNTAFVYPTPEENQECFLEGMKQCFEQMGGVPRRMWFDNLSAAGVHIGKHGERQLTEGFQRFCAHYRMEAIFL
jgi:transposase